MGRIPVDKEFGRPATHYNGRARFSSGGGGLAFSSDAGAFAWFVATGL